MSLSRRLAHRLAAAVLATSTAFVAPALAKPVDADQVMIADPQPSFSSIAATVAGMVGDEAINQLVAVPELSQRCRRQSVVYAKRRGCTNERRAGRK